jgi:hypothetical protein
MSASSGWKVRCFLSLCAAAGSGAWLTSGCSDNARSFAGPASGGASAGDNATGGDDASARGGAEMSAGGVRPEGGEAGAESGGRMESAGASSELGGAAPGSAGASGEAGAECVGGSTMVRCDGGCTNVASDPKNCRACGHDCGTGSECKAGVCQPVVLHTSTQAITHLDADQARIYFSPPGVVTCPAEGCTLSPQSVSDSPPSGTTFVAHGYVGIHAPNPAPPNLGTLLQLCPTSGCTSDNAVTLDQSNKNVSYGGVLSSANNFYWTASNPGGHLLRSCLTPSAGGCGAGGTIFGFVGSAVAATDDAIYLHGALDGGESALYSCPASLVDCNPTPMNPPPGYTRAIAHAKDLYIAPSVTGPNITIVKCPMTGCTSENQTPVVSVKYDTPELAVDASGIYWIDGDLIRTCPLAGCVGGPQTVAVTSAPRFLRLRGGFVYWVDTTNNEIERVAEPAR